MLSTKQILKEQKDNMVQFLIYATLTLMAAAGLMVAVYGLKGLQSLVEDVKTYKGRK